MPTGGCRFKHWVLKNVQGFGQNSITGKRFVLLVPKHEHRCRAFQGFCDVLTGSHSAAPCHQLRPQALVLLMGS